MENSLDLLIVTMESDPSGFRFREEAEQRGLHYAYHLYRDLTASAVPAPELGVDAQTKLLARRPCHSNDVANNYFSLLRILLDANDFAAVFDAGLYAQDYLALADKLMKQYVLESLELPVAPLVSFDAAEACLPVVVKKRLAGRSTANHLAKSAEELEALKKSLHMPKYVIQQYFPLRQDYRVLVLGSEILGVVRRDIRFREDGRVSVKVAEEARVSDVIASQCIRLAEHLGADLLGVDVGVRENDEHFYIEYNWSPQFIGLEEKTGINVAGAVVDYLMEQGK